MPAEHLGPPYGQVVLVVGAAELDVGERRQPAPLDEAAGHLQVAFRAGLTVELDQRHLDLRVPADSGALHEARADVVGGAADHVPQLVLAVGALAGDPGLDQVAVAVQLMAPLQVGVPRAGPAGVEIAVGLLRGGDDAGQLLDPGIARPGHRLHQLVDLGVAELASAPRAAREVGDPPHLLHPGVAMIDDRLGRLRSPEPGQQADLRQAEGGEGAGGGHDGTNHARLLT